MDSCPRLDEMPTGQRLRQLADTYTSQFCTLDGVRARIYGRRERFATIAQLDPPHLACEWSWNAVESVMLHGGGDFNS